MANTEKPLINENQEETKDKVSTEEVQSNSDFQKEKEGIQEKTKAQIEQEAKLQNWHEMFKTIVEGYVSKSMYYRKTDVYINRIEVKKERETIQMVINWMEEYQKKYKEEDMYIYNARRILGDVHAYFGEYKEAIHYYALALIQLKTTDVVSMRASHYARIYLSLSGFYKQKGWEEKAKRFHEIGVGYVRKGRQYDVLKK